MNRRSFLSRLAKSFAGIALAAHMKFGELVPVTPAIVEEVPIISRIDILAGWSTLYADCAVRIMS